jgi:hypothetical protein
MPTTMRKELHYDASPDAVVAMLKDAAFREQVLERSHVLRGSASVDGNDVTIEQVQSAGSLPSFARKLVGDEIVIIQKEQWHGTTGDIHVSIPGKPGEMEGTAVLTSVGAGTVEVVEMTIRVAIPLVAGKIERLVADMLEKALAKEHEVGQEWLAR